MLTFECYSEIMKMFKNLTEIYFDDRKKQLIYARREALKNGDETKYAKIVKTMLYEEQKIANHILIYISKKLGISKIEFL